MCGSHPAQRLGLVDQAVVAQLQRQPYRCLRRALRGPGLQQPQRAVFDGELDLLHVGREPLQRAGRVDQLAVDPRQPGAQCGDRLDVKGA